MALTNAEKQKRYREKSKLLDVNYKIYKNDIVRGLKKTSKKDEIILRETIRISGKEGENRYSDFVKRTLRQNFEGGDNTLFVTLTYTHVRNVSVPQNNEIIDRFISFLVGKDLVDSIIFIAESHRERPSVHNHGLIRVKAGKLELTKRLFQKYWIENQAGSCYYTKLDPMKKFEEYLTKYLKSRGNVYRFSDGFVFYGLDFLNESGRTPSLGSWSAVPVLNDRSPKPVQVAKIDKVNDDPTTVDLLILGYVNALNWMQNAFRTDIVLFEWTTTVFHLFSLSLCLMLILRI